MQTISQNKITQGVHGPYNAVDIGPSPDIYWYAPEDCTINEVHTVDDNTCGKYVKFTGATGQHTVCHNSIIYVKVGAKVKRGQKMAKMGYTGLTVPDNVPGGTHAHWILNSGGKWVYPPSKVNQTFIKQGVEEVTSRKTAIRLLRTLQHVSDPKETYIKEWTGLNDDQLATKLLEVYGSSWFKKQTAKIQAPTEYADAGTVDGEPVYRKKA